MVIPSGRIQPCLAGAALSLAMEAGLVSVVMAEWVMERNSSDWGGLGGEVITGKY